MTDTPKSRAVIQGQVLPPLPAQRFPPAPLGIPLLALIKNSWDERQLDSYTAVEEAISRHLEVLRGQVELKGRLMETHARWEGRLSRIDKIRDIAAAEVDEELDTIQRRARLNAKREDLELARLEYELKAARKASDDLDKAPAATADRTTRAQLEAALGEVREIESALDGYIAHLLERAGGEAQLSEDERRHVDMVRMLKANKVADLYDRLNHAS